MFLTGEHTSNCVIKHQTFFTIFWEINTDNLLLVYNFVSILKIESVVCAIFKFTSALNVPDIYFNRS